jgi:P-aminobenzoate N-oxygenase AurF
MPSTPTATLPADPRAGSAPPSGKKPVDRHDLSARLLRSAAKKSYDPVVDIDWDAPTPEGLYGLSPEWSSLFGTPLWDELAEDQRITLTIHEMCSISGVGIWFECLLMQLVLRDIYGEDPAQPHVQWALTEIADECRHSVMFARSAEKLGVPSYQPPPGILRLGKLFAAKGDGASAYAAILVAEEILDIFQRDLMKDERVLPLIRAGSQIHVVEEARHMRFAREEIARRAPELNFLQRRKHRTVVASVAAIVADNLVQPQVYAAVGLDPARARAAARANEHYAAKLRGAAAGLVSFLREVGLIGGPSELLWKRARLL